jgi:hypothetical protein
VNSNAEIKIGITPITPKVVPMISAVEKVFCPAAGAAEDVGVCVVVLETAVVEAEGAVANFLY